MGTHITSDPNMDDDARRLDKYRATAGQDGQAAASGAEPAEVDADSTGQADGGTEPATEGGTHSALGGPAAPSPTRPPGNASREDWADYAVANGHTEAGIEGMSRDEIRGLFA